MSQMYESNENCFDHMISLLTTQINLTSTANFWMNTKHILLTARYM